jgi:hypothetical protein
MKLEKFSPESDFLRNFVISLRYIFCCTCRILFGKFCGIPEKSKNIPKLAIIRIKLFRCYVPQNFKKNFHGGQIHVYNTSTIWFSIRATALTYPCTVRTSTSLKILRDFRSGSHLSRDNQISIDGQVRLVRLQTDKFRLFLRQQMEKVKLPSS